MASWALWDPRLVVRIGTLTNNSVVCPIVAGAPVLAAWTGRIFWAAGNWVAARNWHSRLRSCHAAWIDRIAVLKMRKFTEHAGLEMKIGELLIDVNQHFLERSKVIPTVVIVVHYHFVSLLHLAFDARFLLGFAPSLLSLHGVCGVPSFSPLASTRVLNCMFTGVYS